MSPTFKTLEDIARRRRVPARRWTHARMENVHAADVRAAQQPHIRKPVQRRVHRTASRHASTRNSPVIHDVHLHRVSIAPEHAAFVVPPHPATSRGEGAPFRPRARCTPSICSSRLNAGIYAAVLLDEAVNSTPDSPHTPNMFIICDCCSLPVNEGP